MASSRVTSNSPDWKDLAGILDSFEAQNGLSLEIALATVVTGNTLDLRIGLAWWPVGEGKWAAKPSDYLSVTCLATNRRTLEAAILALLYQLDFKLAADVFTEPKKKQ